MSKESDFSLLELTIANIHQALKDQSVTARELVQGYLERIEAFDRGGPNLNSVISLNENALAEADVLDRARAEGRPTGPLHGVPILVKDQVDVAGMRTTLGSILFENYRPDRDSFVVCKLKQAGAIVLGKTTLGELGAGDTHGSLFGSTKNAYDPLRTAGGSSGGSGTAVSANFCAVAVGQEGFASIRRPAAWNGIAGMRPTAGLVSRSGVYGGWPGIHGSLGPMARTVSDLAMLLNCMVGYDPEDPVTALGASRIVSSYAAGLDAQALKGARIGILREPCGYDTDPNSADFRSVDEVFGTAVEELRRAGATIIDPCVLPDLKALLATRSKTETEDDEAFEVYFAGQTNAPFASRKEAMASSLFSGTFHGVHKRWRAVHDRSKHHAYLVAREKLMMNLHQVFAQHGLDAIVHKAVEHQATLIEDGVKPPYRDQTGAIDINTFLVFVPSVVVPCGFTSSGLPAGITFLGRPYEDAEMLRLAFAYEQSTRHRRPPSFAG